MSDSTDTPTHAKFLRATFKATGRQGRVRCQTCGRAGYAGGQWQDGCRRGHLPCLRCGSMLTVKLDGTARVHARCVVRLKPAPPPGADHLD